MSDLSKIACYSRLNQVDKKIFQKKIVLVGGCFDLIHYGHLQFLKKAKDQGEVLIIALEPDEFIRKRKNRNPFHSQKERAEILASFYFVDLVILLPLFRSDDDYLELVKRVKPRVIAVTRGDEKLNNKKSQAGWVGAQVKIVTNRLRKFSTRRIINLLLAD
ncbi:MAG: adenylyltransferase/cytidyltransferase family protein [Patescibacteria group bacterium]|nr:adenylyltransferase/cytidyltransferase family protein [Patescibacteria group bacterium]